MKSFSKILSLVLTLTMMVSLVVMPNAYAAIKFPVGDTSAYEVAATFVQADGITEVTEVEAGDTVYLRLDLKNFSTLNSGYADITLEGATFVAETNKLSDAIFAKDSDLTEFTAGGTYASYGISTDVSNLTSTNKKVKYYAFAEATDMYLALYEVKVDADATGVTATVSQNLKLGDANGVTGNQPATAEGIVLTNDSLVVATGGGEIFPDPVITYSYVAKWADVGTSENVFPEGTEEATIKENIIVRKTTYSDGIETDIDTMEDGFTAVLNDGNVTVTIDADPNAQVECNLTYTIAEHVPVITYDYEISWKDDISEFDFGTSDAVITSNVVVTKITYTDGIETGRAVMNAGYEVTLASGVVSVSVGGVVLSDSLEYTIIPKIEYKNATATATEEFDYDEVVNNLELVEETVSVTVEKWVNDVKDSDIELEADDFDADAVLTDNENAGVIEIELLGDYADLDVADIPFILTNPTVAYTNVVAVLTETEFHESVDESVIAAAVSVTAAKKVGRLPAENVTLSSEFYSVQVDFDAKIVTVSYVEGIFQSTTELDFELILAVITYENAEASLSDDVFGTVPTAEDIIARLTVTATKLKDGVADGSVAITSENYDVEIGDGVATITFKNAYAELEAVEVEFSVEELAYGNPVIVVEGTISADGKSNATIVDEAWELITASRDILTNGIVTGSEDLDKAALEALGVTVEINEGVVEFTLGGQILAEVSISMGKLQFASADPRTSHKEFVKFVGATLKNIFDNIKVKKDIFQIIELNADEWETLSEAIANGEATVTVDGTTYDATNLDDADSVVVDSEDSKTLEVVYKDVADVVEVGLLTVATDYANEDNEAPVVSITVDALQVQTGTDVTATVYVDGLEGNIETGYVTILYSNASVTVDDITAADGFEILDKEVTDSTIMVTFTINAASYDAGAGIFEVAFDTTDSDVNAKLGLAVTDYALTRMVDMGEYNEYKPLNATIGDNVEVTVTAGDVLGYEYDVSYKSGKDTFYADADAVADVKVLAYTTTNGVIDEGQTPVDVTADCDINANNGVITVDKDGVRVDTLTYSIYEVSFEQLVAIDTIGSVADDKFVNNTTVKLNGTDVATATIALDGRSIKAAVAGIKAEGTYEVAVAVPGYTKATINVVVSKKATLDGYTAAVVTGSKIYAGDINGDNRIDAVDFSDVTGKYNQAKETKYDLYTGNDSATIDNLDVTTMAHYFITLARGQVSADGTTITPYQG